MTIYLSSASSVSNKLFLTPTNIISITRAEQISGSVDAEVLGERVCISKGSATGNRCGTLLHTMVVLGGGLTDQRMASNMWACGGDSGSPVYDGSKAIGSSRKVRTAQPVQLTAASKAQTRSIPTSTGFRTN
jgi:hypothetical protein